MSRKRKTIYVKLEDDLDTAALDRILNAIDDIPGVYSVTMSEPVHDPRQGVLFEDVLR